MMPLLERLFDDASIFPPANVGVSRSLADHASHKKAWYAETVGFFVCSERRWPGLASALQVDPADPVDLALVVAGGLSSLTGAVSVALHEPRVTLRAVEVPVSIEEAEDVQGAVRLLDGLPPGVQGYLELQFGDDVEIGVTALHGTEHRAKFRTGGENGRSAPDALLLAEAVRFAIQEAVPFKLTAGLHHALVAHAGAGHIEHHGFLNVLIAVSLAVDGAPTGVVAAALEQEDATALAELVHAMSEEQMRRVRAAFVSFGTCSILEPLADLRELGLVGS